MFAAALAISAAANAAPKEAEHIDCASPEFRTQLITALNALSEEQRSSIQNGDVTIRLLLQAESARAPRGPIVIDLTADTVKTTNTGVVCDGTVIFDSGVRRGFKFKFEKQQQ